MLTAIRKNGLILAIFACVSTGLVALTYALTAEQIQQQEQKQLLQVLNQVIPHKYHDNPLAQACTLVKDDKLGTAKTMHAYLAQRDGQPTAIAIETIAPDGYNGEIKLIVGIANNGTVLGVRVLAHQETPGLGDKIDLRISNWVLGFNGQQVTADNQDDWKVRKDGGQFDQFTGATITPRAVVLAVKKAVEYVNQHQQQLHHQPNPCEGQ
ncbi:electron transport complex subunit RsxG [Vibrio cholerae]|uniref:electron transport complex subunit RsxG n=1 Tax=Vibrio paracholerae TaxID=650003 RepID=UPI000DE55E7A|nr:electron transport complex subunit RsxG [Vibrio paracholerae]ELJ8549184.1 electron transport complex subunit RsxG [Vibrio cholerae]ELY5189401.1 electron transport complex subunit RsxG [Vibrio cholerae]ELY5288267.1 electron transport complex subunit RsxG [Vibrio cholerae]RBM75741.1 electron transport complex subunit RsxG [Vibrio paracholerae]